MKVKEVCNCNVVYATPETTACDCAKLMNTNNIGCIPICDDTKKLVGILTDRDIVLRTIACDKDPKKTQVSEIMTCNVCSCIPNTDIEEAEDIMSQNGIRRIPIIDNNKVVGMLTIKDLITNQELSADEVTITLDGICKCDDKNNY